jgi:hypothetical protein
VRGIHCNTCSLTDAHYSRTGHHADDSADKCRNEFETFLFHTRSKVDNELKGKLGDSEETVTSALKDGLDWLEENSNADVSAYKDKQNEIHDIVKPIIAKYEEASKGASGDADDHEEL